MAEKVEGSTVKVGVTWEKDLIFKVNFEGIEVPDVMVDETNKNEAEMTGVTPARLLARATTGRDPDGRLRVQEISVDLHPKTTDPTAMKRLAECKKVFEKFCTVTESVRKGIKVLVNVVES
jgi:hypothetical protein